MDTVIVFAVCVVLIRVDFFSPACFTTNASAIFFASTVALNNKSAFNNNSPVASSFDQYKLAVFKSSNGVLNITGSFLTASRISVFL